MKFFCCLIFFLALPHLASAKKSCADFSETSSREHYYCALRFTSVMSLGLLYQPVREAEYICDFPSDKDFGDFVQLIDPKANDDDIKNVYKALIQIFPMNVWMSDGKSEDVFVSDLYRKTAEVFPDADTPSAECVNVWMKLFEPVIWMKLFEPVKLDELSR
jgi:hypothetical protein